MSTAEILAAVKQHALDNYEQDGWDVVVETYEDDELAELIGDAETVEVAIDRVGEVVGIYDERRREIQSLAF